jgi:hypothetical protein
MNTNPKSSFVSRVVGFSIPSDVLFGVLIVSPNLKADIGHKIKAVKPFIFNFDYWPYLIHAEFKARFHKARFIILLKNLAS